LTMRYRATLRLEPWNIGANVTQGAVTTGNPVGRCPGRHRVGRLLDAAQPALRELCAEEGQNFVDQKRPPHRSAPAAKLSEERRARVTGDARPERGTSQLERSGNGQSLHRPVPPRGCVASLLVGPVAVRGGGRNQPKEATPWPSQHRRSISPPPSRRPSAPTWTGPSSWPPRPAWQARSGPESATHLPIEERLSLPGGRQHGKRYVNAPSTTYLLGDQAKRLTLQAVREGWKRSPACSIRR
jgi:hypothetical protein